MNPVDLVLFGILIVAVLYLRHQNRKEYMRLADAQKRSLETDLRMYRLIQFGILILTLGLLFFLSPDRNLERSLALSLGAAGVLLLLAWGGVGSFFLYKEMVRLGFPMAYVRVFLIDRIFPVLLLAVLIGLTIRKVWGL